MLLRALQETRDGLLGLSYPAECRVCGGAIESWDDGVSCAACWGDPTITEIIRSPLCSKCGAPTRRATFPDSSSHQRTAGGQDREDFKTCRQCGSLPFSAARSCGTYSGALEASILFLKSHPHLCRRMRDLINRTFSEQRAALESDLIMPVPLHHLRERARGFNQAEMIGRVISRRFDLPLDDGSLVRVKPTERHRAGVDARDRAESVEGAFCVVRPRLIQSASILVVDDVMTTGSTIGAVARTLLEAGARTVSVLTIARVADGTFPLLTR
jgi:ComF family protein